MPLLVVFRYETSMYLNGKREIVTATEVGIHGKKIDDHANTARFIEAPRFQWYFCERVSRIGLFTNAGILGGRSPLEVWILASVLYDTA